jgi:hypothetical protein
MDAADMSGAYFCTSRWVRKRLVEAPKKKGLRGSPSEIDGSRSIMASNDVLGEIYRNKGF